MSVIIDVKDVSKTYAEEEVSTRALCGVSLLVQEGEFVAIMGPSGSGKSTLLHVLGLLDKPTGGTYIFDGEDTTGFDEAQRAFFRNKMIGFIFQAFHLLPRASVLDNVMLPLHYSSVPVREHRSRALAALENVDMTHRLNHTPSQLSGGEKQRVAIARALVNKPKVIFADEPTGNLDSRTGKDVMETIEQLHKLGHTIIVITHETPAASYAQRIVAMQDGLIVSDETQVSPHTHYHK